MILRSKMAKTATRLIKKFGDDQRLVTVTSTPGLTEYDSPTLGEVVITVSAVVTGVSKWEVGGLVLATDLKALVSGGVQVFDAGDMMKIDGDNYTIVAVNKVLAGGEPSLVKYFLRAG